MKRGVWSTRFSYLSNLLHALLAAQACIKHGFRSDAATIWIRGPRTDAEQVCRYGAWPTAFRSLSHGKLFLPEIDHAERPVASTSFPGRKERLERRVERYWLCDCCSSLFFPDLRTWPRNGYGSATWPEYARAGLASEEDAPMKGYPRRIERAL